MAMFLALIASLAWGTADFLGGFTSQKSDPNIVTLWRSILVLPVALALAILAGGYPSPADVGWSELSGVCASFGFIVLFKALAEGRMSVVAPMSGVAAATTPLVAGLVAGERPSPMLLTSLLVAVGAIVAVSTGGGDPLRGAQHLRPLRRSNTAVGNDLGLATASGFCFGMAYVALHHTTSTSHLWPLLIDNVTIVVTAIIAALVYRRPLLPRGFNWRVNAGAGLVDAFGTSAFLASSHDHSMMMVAGVFASLYPVVTVILACLVLREPLGRMNVVGLGVATLAVALVAST